MSVHKKSVDMDVEPQDVDHKVGIVRDVDQAAQFLAETQDYPPLTPEQEKKLVRKVDWIMIPMVCSLRRRHTSTSTDANVSWQLFLTATFGAVDKVSLSTAAIYGLQTDTNLVGQQYSWLGSILSLGVSHLN